MPNTKPAHRLTLFALVFIVLAGVFITPAFALTSYGFPAEGLVWLLAVPVVSLIVLFALVLWLVAAFRPR